MENGYRFDKLLIISPIILLLVLFIYAASTYGFVAHPYFNCVYSTCPNPFLPHNGNPSVDGLYTRTPSYQSTCQGVGCLPFKCDEAWCKQEYLTRGEYGKKAPIYLNINFVAISEIILYALVFYLNHILYNKGKKFSISQKRQILPNWMYNILPKKWSEQLRKAETEGFKELEDKLKNDESDKDE
jgi:hypothetical protein